MLSADCTVGLAFVDGHRVGARRRACRGCRRCRSRSSSWVPAPSRAVETSTVVGDPSSLKFAEPRTAAPFVTVTVPDGRGVAIAGLTASADAAPRSRSRRRPARARPGRWRPSGPWLLHTGRYPSAGAWSASVALSSAQTTSLEAVVTARRGRDREALVVEVVHAARPVVDVLDGELAVREGEHRRLAAAVVVADRPQLLALGVEEDVGDMRRRRVRGGEQSGVDRGDEAGGAVSVWSRARK